MIRSPISADHSLPRLLDAGAFVTINTDDPPLFSTTLNDEYLRIAATFGLNIGVLSQLVINGVTASFLDAAVKQKLISEIVATTKQHSP